MTRPRQAMPGQLKVVLAILVLQGVLNVFTGVVLFDAVSTAEGHGQRVDGAGLVYFLAVLSVAIGVLLLVCAALSGQRKAWTRTAVLWVEGIGLVSALINIVQGATPAVFGLVLTAVVLFVMTRDEVKGWYSLR